MCWSEYITKARRLKIYVRSNTRDSEVVQSELYPQAEISTQPQASKIRRLGELPASRQGWSPISDQTFHAFISFPIPIHVILTFRYTQLVLMVVHKRCKENPSNKENKWPTYCKCCLQSTWIYSQVELIISIYDLICICVHINQT